MTATLSVQLPNGTFITALDGQAIHLNRALLTDGADETVPNDSHCPLILPLGDNNWLLHNQHPDTELPVDLPDKRRKWVSAEQNIILQPGNTTVLFQNVTVTITIEGREFRSPKPAKPTPQEVMEHKTNPPVYHRDAKARVDALFEENPLTRRVMQVKYQDFIATDPAIAARPCPLTDSQVVQCLPKINMGLKDKNSRHRASNIQKTVVAAAVVKGSTIDPVTLGRWLVESGLLKPADYANIPHLPKEIRDRSRKNLETPLPTSEDETD